MIRLLRRLGRFPVGTETDAFSAAEEAAFVLDGTAEEVSPALKSRLAPKAAPADAPEAPGTEPADYAHMRKDDLLKLAMARGLDVSPRAKVADVVAALEASDDA